MRSFYPEQLAHGDVYRLLTGALVPRPIAWVSTLNEDGSFNLAPFSFFTAVSSDPPILAVAISRRTNGEKKDSLLNIERTGQFVVNIADDRLSREVQISGRDLPYGESEFTAAGLSASPSERVAPPRVSEAPVAMECQACGERVDYGRKPYTLVLGEVVALHFRDDIVTPAGRTLFEVFRPLGRLAGKMYARFGAVIDEEAVPR
jgi:flavin reductase (DIM6/NTAB) family NADH-FMN oxidoreductase RutF